MGNQETEKFSSFDERMANIFLRRFQTEMEHKELAGVTLYCIIAGAIKLAENQKFHVRTKETDIRHYCIRETAKKEQLKV